MYPKKTQKLDRIGAPGDLLIFLIHLSQIIKKIEGDPLVKQIFWKVSQCWKKTENGGLWDFSASMLSQNSKNLSGTRWGIFSKSLTMPFSLARYCMLRGKKPFWSLQVNKKNTDEKPSLYSTLFLRKAPTKNVGKIFKYFSKVQFQAAVTTYLHEGVN